MWFTPVEERRELPQAKTGDPRVEKALQEIETSKTSTHADVNKPPFAQPEC